MKKVLIKESLKKKINSDYRNGFFEFTTKKVDGIYHPIGKIRCKEAYNLYELDEHGNKKWFPFYDFCFDDFLPIYKDHDAEVEEGDIINVRTIINSEFDFPPYSDELDSASFSLYKKDPQIGITFLVSSIYRRGLGQLILNAPTSYAVCAKAHVCEAHTRMLNTSGNSPLLYESSYSFTHITP